MPKRGESATSAQKDALKAGQAKRKAAIAKAKKEGAPSAGERFAMLLSGTLSVRDLDDQEISKMRVRGADGGFGGKPRALPSHIAQQFHHEAIRRAQDKFRTGVGEAVQALLDIGSNPDVKESDRVRALTYIVDRALGKTPETVITRADNPWDDLMRQGGSLEDMRDLAGLADGLVGPEDLA